MLRPVRGMFAVWMLVNRVWMDNERFIGGCRTYAASLHFLLAVPACALIRGGRTRSLTPLRTVAAPPYRPLQSPNSSCT